MAFHGALEGLARPIKGKDCCYDLAPPDGASAGIHVAHDIAALAGGLEGVGAAAALNGIDIPVAVAADAGLGFATGEAVAVESPARRAAPAAIGIADFVTAPQITAGKDPKQRGKSRSL